MLRRYEDMSKEKSADLTGSLTLQNIRLASCSAALGELDNNRLPNVGQQEIQFELGLTPDQKNARSTVAIKLDSRYAETPKKSPPQILVQATFQVFWQITDTFGSSEGFEKPIRDLSMRLIWPYWRELVQSMTTRMGLPPFPIPIIYVDTIFEKTKKKSKPK
jgi:preprotein translocase subunit SecB